MMLMGADFPGFAVGARTRQAFSKPSFQIATEMGDHWERKMNDKRLELENDGKRWLIIAGM